MDNRSTDRTAPTARPARIAGHALVGRDAELELLGAFLAGVPRLGGSLVVLGEPGVGKTALLAAVRAGRGRGDAGAACDGCAVPGADQLRRTAAVADVGARKPGGSGGFARPRRGPGLQVGQGTWAGRGR
ncbi:ATP-binding protein [Streptomyces tubercidicus]